MSLSIGIVGLPNAGKSTLFNALVKSHLCLGSTVESRREAKVASHPFTTIEPNIGIVEIPDERLDKIAQRLNITRKIPAVIKFIDIAGLIKNASLGEGLGNQFLSHIREVDALIHVIRCFEDQNVPHIHQKIDPKYDREIINLELELAGIKKPTLSIYNVSENQIKNYLPDNDGCLSICAKLESELIDLSPAEQREYLKGLGQKENALEKLIQKSYQLLGLITFYTLKPDQMQSWAVKEGALAPMAAGKVHTDMEKGFIAAEIINWQELLKYNSWPGAKTAGGIRTEGKNYQIQDGDVVLFRFSTAS
ncbi:YchF family ATPase [Candidatus Berkelbacteria bacterium]|nr:YchF family ATPase [Candidatus Berkelbacteria bacterium]MBI2588118.1 YchF family ATPase [Candidatus Berkelbacteria bacterium]